MAQKSKIKIKKSAQSSLRAIAGVKPNQTIPLATLQKLAKSKDPKIRAKAQFALNARKFKH